MVRPQPSRLQTNLTIQPPQIWIRHFFSNKLAVNYHSVTDKSKPCNTNGNGVRKLSWQELFYSCMITQIHVFGLFVYIPLICMWVFARSVFLFNSVIKRFESLKALYKFPIIVIISSSIDLCLVWVVLCLELAVHQSLPCAPCFLYLAAVVCI